MTTGQGENRDFSSDPASYILHGSTLLIISYTLFWIQGSPFYWTAPNLLILNVTLSLLLLLVIGIINVASSEYLWSLNCKSNIENWIVQGFLVFVPTQILLMPFTGIMIALYSLSGRLVFLAAIVVLGYTVIFGYIGRAVAKMYVEKDSYEQTQGKLGSPIIRETRGRCPSCGESYRYSTHDFSSESTVKCFNCGHAFYLEPTEELLKKLDTNREESRTDPEHDS